MGYARAKVRLWHAVSWLVKFKHQSVLVVFVGGFSHLVVLNCMHYILPI